MARTSLVGSTAWVQLTPSAGQKVGVSMIAPPLDAHVYLMTGADNPGVKTEPAEGDDAVVFSAGALLSTFFDGLDAGDHVWARSSKGSHKIFVTTKFGSA